MIPYENYTTAALKVELENIKSLMIRVRDMQRPSNFTYIDITNIYNHLDVLKRCIISQLESRKEN